MGGSLPGAPLELVPSPAAPLDALRELAWRVVRC